MAKGCVCPHPVTTLQSVKLTDFNTLEQEMARLPAAVTAP